MSDQILKSGRGKIIIGSILFAVMVAGALFWGHSGQSRIKPYYSGETVAYQGDIYVGTVNTGDFELFLWQEDGLHKKTNIMSTFHKHPHFNDLKFEKNDGRLYVYLIDGRYLYKYDLSNPLVPEREARIKDNAWDWFQGLEESRGRLVTMGIHGIKVWNKNLEVINSFNINNDVKENISFSPGGKYIFNIKNGRIKIYDTESRQYEQEIDLELKKEGEIRKIYNDPELSLIYVVDDEALKAFNFSAELVRKFEHISPKGCDVIPASDGTHLYFSDGLGIVKVNKYNFEPVDWKHTTDVAEGSWLMRIKAIKPNGEQRIVGFNASNLVVMDSDLEILGHRKSTEEDLSPTEPLFLRVDKNRAPAGTPISLRGGGFGIKEKVRIEFADETFYAYTDDQGRFIKILDVPSVLPTKTDIKVIGEISELDYSLGFRIE